MKEKEIILRAEKFLNGINYPFVKPGETCRHQDNRVEVVFLVHEALNPNCVIDPPDVRVWVDLTSGEVELIYQM